VGPPLFIVTFLIEGAIRPGYSWYRNYASSLGHPSLVRRGAPHGGRFDPRPRRPRRIHVERSRRLRGYRTVRPGLCSESRSSRGGPGPPHSPTGCVATVVPPLPER